MFSTSKEVRYSFAHIMFDDSPTDLTKVGIESVRTAGFLRVKTQHNLLDFIRRDLSN